MTPTTNNTEMVKQVKNAFNFVQKLYSESAYLVKEIEGQLSETNPNFQMLRPSGYAISSRSSTGLEPNHVNLWLLRKFAVAFVEVDENIQETKQTFTKIDKKTKILYIRIVLDSKDLSEPTLFYGILHEIELKKDSDKKFENVMSHFNKSRVDEKMFSLKNKIDYKDGRIELIGKYKTVSLLNINSSEDLMEKVLEPALKLYATIK